MQPHKQYCRIYLKSLNKLSIRFSFFCVFFVSKGNLLDFYLTLSINYYFQDINIILFLIIIFKVLKSYKILGYVFVISWKYYHGKVDNISIILLPRIYFVSPEFLMWNFPSGHVHCNK